MICPRCNYELLDTDSHDEDINHVRTHRLETCFRLVKGDLDMMTDRQFQGEKTQSKLQSWKEEAGDSKTKDLLTQIDTLTATVKRDAETIKELTAQVEARDEEMTKAAFEAEDDEPAGKKKK